MYKSLYPWKDEPTVSALWSQFVDGNRGTDVVIADQSFMLVRNIDKQVFSFNDYLNRSIVAYLPNPDHNGKVFLIEGTSSEATEAGGGVLLSESRLSSFQEKLHVATLPYFEVLLKTSQASDTPFATVVTAYRTYPALRWFFLRCSAQPVCPPFLVRNALDLASSCTLGNNWPRVALNVR